MTLKPYTGNNRTNVSKDAKYSVTALGEIRLEYRVGTRTKYLLTTSRHPDLVDLVNAAKLEIAGSPGGAFYINEFKDVLVPDGQGGTYWVESYDGVLEFEFDEGEVISPAAPKGLQPGDIWAGPHVGIPYVLSAGGHDVKYERQDGRRRDEVRLSDEVGDARARATALRISRIKGSSGGGFYINECGELFAPVASNQYRDFLYAGHIGESAWFDPPDGFPRP